MEGNSGAPAPSQPSAGQTSQGASQNTPPSTASNLGKEGNLPSKAGSPTPNTHPTSNEYFDVKVNGKMVKMSKQEVLDHASMAYHANDRFNEAKKIKSQIDKIIGTAKQDPIQALLDPALGLSKEQIRDAMEKWYHQEFIEPESLNEDQKRNKELQAKLRKYQEQEELAKRQSEEEEQTKLTSHHREILTQQIIEALETSGLPKTKFFASRMAFYMRQNATNGWEAPLDLIVKQVKQERTQIMSDMSEGASAEQLISLLGDSVINKIRQHDLKKLREKRNLPPASVSDNSVSSTRTGEKVYSSDVNRRLRDMRSGRWK